jgi:hypothetical protein
VGEYVGTADAEDGTTLSRIVGDSVVNIVEGSEDGTSVRVDGGFVVKPATGLHVGISGGMTVG